MKTRSGARYQMREDFDVLRTSRLIAPLLAAAFATEEARHTAGEEDCEGHDIETVLDSHHTHPCSPSPTPHTLVTASDHASGNYATLSRRRRRAKAAGKLPRTAYPAPRSSLLNKRAAPDYLETNLSTTELPAARGGYLGKRLDSGTRAAEVDELCAQGFVYEEWDGLTPRVLLDDEGRIFAVLVGQPNDPQWVGECQAAANLMESTQKQCRLSKKQRVHRRGNFSCLSVGVSHGGGQKAPGNLRHNKTNKKQLDILLASPSIRRIAGFGSSVFAHYFPKLYANYAQTLEALFKHHPRLHRIFRNSIFPVCTFNLSPDTVCLRHTDHGNKANGICHIHALGNYNPKTGGHIILYSIKRIIEFPPASSILIPSATVEHGNIPVQPHEKRFSFTQYAAGGLFRWVRYGFRTADALEESHDDELKEAVRRELDTNWQRALGLYSKVDDLLADRAQVFGD